MPSTRRVLTENEARRIVAERCLPATTRHSSIGLELEFLSFTADRGRPSLDTLESLAATPLPSGGRVTCEPGGQVEASSPPQPTAAEAIAVTAHDVAALRKRAEAGGVELVAVGADRWRPPQRVVDSCRYRAMEAHFDAINDAGRQMMCNTAALQINIDGGHDRWRVAHLIGPAMVAAFANSPGDDRMRSTRVANWLAMELGRTRAVTGPLPDAWIDYAFAAPALVARNDDDGECIAIPEPAPFLEWLNRGGALGFPTAADLTYHLTMLFPPVRPRQWIEIRYLDALPSPWWEVATLVVAALLDDAVVTETTAAVAGTETLWADAAAHGLDDVRLARAADNCFALALAFTGDAGVADYLERYVARRVPAWA
ncbi:MAG: ergothioneine biosynthesis glutamate--cysteine ligase EgtA [Actinobacteria bacterium]|nr:ergothioneine biosynthesis glutamate--cysteine ligase EgtA [Actinomycetota bacterium]